MSDKYEEAFNKLRMQVKELDIELHGRSNKEGYIHEFIRERAEKISIIANNIALIAIEEGVNEDMDAASLLELLS